MLAYATLARRAGRLCSALIHSPGMARVARPVESKLDRKDCHVEAETEYMLPGGLCKSKYNGASQGRKCLEMLVAQISRPRHCSRALAQVFQLLTQLV